MSEAPVEPAVPVAETPSARSRAWRALSSMRSGSSPRTAEVAASPRPKPGGTATPPQVVRADELDSALSMSACAIRCD